MADPGTLFWLWVLWTVIVSATAVSWWYESQVVAGYKRRNERLARDLEVARDRL
jgi:hypothetical protein